MCVYVWFNLMHEFKNSELFNPIIATFLKYFFKQKFAEPQMQFSRQFTSVGSKVFEKRIVLFGQSAFRGKNSTTSMEIRLWPLACD